MKLSTVRYLNLSSQASSFCAFSRSCYMWIYSSGWSWISAFTAWCLLWSLLSFLVFTSTSCCRDMRRCARTAWSPHLRSSLPAAFPAYDISAWPALRPSVSVSSAASWCDPWSSGPKGVAYFLLLCTWLQADLCPAAPAIELPTSPASSSTVSASPCSPGCSHSGLSPSLPWAITSAPEGNYPCFSPKPTSGSCSRWLLLLLIVVMSSLASQALIIYPS